VARARRTTKAPLAVAGILGTPLFFTALMAMSLAVEKPAVHHVFRHGNLVTKLGDPSGTTEAKIWLLAFLFPLAVVLIGVAAIRLGRAGVVVSSLAAVAAAIALLVPLDTWTSEHSARYLDGVDLIPRSAGSQDIYLHGEWEATARHTSEQLGLATIVIAGMAVAILVLFEIRRRRGPVPPPAPPPPEIVEGESHTVRSWSLRGRFP
jgi:hypothetical protein